MFYIYNVYLHAHTHTHTHTHTHRKILEGNRIKIFIVLILFCEW